MCKRLIVFLMVLLLVSGGALAANQPIDGDTWQRIGRDLKDNLVHPVPEAYRITLSSGDWHAAWKEQDTLTVLLMGTDSVDTVSRDGQAEVVMVCAVNLKTGAIRLLSLPETQNVQPEALPGEIWLKYVHCFGGPELMVQTVNDVLGLPMAKYCAVNLNSFVETLDKLGGVTMNLTAYDADALGLSPGENQLTGGQALDYVKLTGEGTRQSRAMALLSALGRQVMSSLSLRTVGTLLNFVITAIDTNLTYDNLMDLVFAVLDSPNGLSISSQSADLQAGNVIETSREFLYGN